MFRTPLFGLGAVFALAASGSAVAETMPSHHGAGSSDMPAMMQYHHAGMNDTTAIGPVMPGQAAFGAVQEIVLMLEADPSTDWSKVNLSALREHLIDMDEVMLRASATETSIDDGLEVAVTGAGRTLAAIRRMVPAHAQELDGLHGWQAKAATLPDGVLLMVTAADPNEVAHIHGLGFIGIMASGSHHQRHHLAMARGEGIH